MRVLTYAAFSHVWILVQAHRPDNMPNPHETIRRSINQTDESIKSSIHDYLDVFGVHLVGLWSGVCAVECKGKQSKEKSTHLKRGVKKTASCCNNKQTETAGQGSNNQQGSNNHREVRSIRSITIKHNYWRSISRSINESILNTPRDKLHNHQKTQQDEQ